MKARELLDTTKRMVRHALVLDWTERRKLASLWLRRITGHRRDGLPSGFPRPEKLLVICHGNIMRSPYTAEMLRHKGKYSGSDAPVIISAGVLDLPGRPADNRAKASAARRGLSLDNHVSQPVTAAHVDWADLIIVMDYLNESILLSRFPHAEDKVVLLGSFGRENDGEPGEIVDPYMYSADQVDSCFVRIDRAVEALWSDLRSRPGSKRH